MNATHLVHLHIDKGSVYWTIECLDPNHEGCKEVTAVGCHCVSEPAAAPCDNCAEGDHGACRVFGGAWYGDCGYECQVEPTGRCFLVEYQDYVPVEEMFDDTITDPSFPLRVDWNHDPDCPLLEIVR